MSFKILGWGLLALLLTNTLNFIGTSTIYYQKGKSAQRDIQKVKQSNEYRVAQSAIEKDRGEYEVLYREANKLPTDDCNFDNMSGIYSRLP